MSLFGIESEDDCRKEIDALLELHDAARRAMNKETIAVLKSELGRHCKKGRSAPEKMSSVEQRYFWPAVKEARAVAPNLGSRKTWSGGLDEIEHKLRSNRPRLETVRKATRWWW
jgi:hypothetical protein